MRYQTTSTLLTLRLIQSYSPTEMHSSNHDDHQNDARFLSDGIEEDLGTGWPVAEPAVASKSCMEKRSPEYEEPS
jgi:hypothetical protein